MHSTLAKLFSVQSRMASTRSVLDHRIRLDAGFHATSAESVLHGLGTSALPTKKISEIATVFGLSDFGLLRIPADEMNGVPFFTVSDIQENAPIPTMFLARSYEPNLANYLVSKGDVLVSRSGSIGNIMLVDGRLAGMAVSNHALRIVPKTPELSSLLYILLSGPIGQSILPQLSYGSVIDQIKSYQVEGISVPIPHIDVLSAIHQKVCLATAARKQATDELFRINASILNVNHLPHLQRATTRSRDRLWNIEVMLIGNTRVTTETDPSEYRLEANFYNSVAGAALTNITRCPSRKAAVAELAHDVIMGKRFKRTYVEAEFGTPFLSGRNIVQIRPKDLNYLSNAHTEGLDDLLLKRGWILVTCSGTIGRTCFVWHNFEDYAASQHILRIVPNQTEVDPGYLYAFLTSPYGYEQILRFRHGSVIDEITDEQMKKVIVPLPRRNEQEEVGDKVRVAYEKRAEALRFEDEAQEVLMGELKGAATVEK